MGEGLGGGLQTPSNISKTYVLCVKAVYEFFKETRARICIYTGFLVKKYFVCQCLIESYFAKFHYT